MHEQKRFLIAAAVALFAFANPVLAQKDAAEKAKEGGIEHWIEYYKTAQPKSSAKPAPEPVDRTRPVERPGSDTSLPEKKNANK